jgi:DNA-directed RNA polymerase specialized sigma24 family protein
MNYEPESRPEDCGEISNISQLHSIALNAFFSRYRRVLHSIAYRVLLNHRDAESAVQNLFLWASRNIPRFKCEGSFRGWLLRGLIDEALAVLHKNRSQSTSCSGPILDPLNFLPPPDPTCEKLRRHQFDKRLTSAELH